MAKGQEDLGHKELAAVFAQRIVRHFAPGSQADASLVIGIFGEWGSGKSNLLQLIEGAVRASTANGEPTVVVVSFNPWRYEREEHLIVPLFKTVRYAISSADSESVGSDQAVVDDKAKGRLRRVAKFFAASAVGFVRAFKGSYEIKVNDKTLKIEFDPREIFTEIEKNTETTQPIPDPFGDHESLYYTFETALQKLTSSPDEPIRLFFLIDDLDRCLPEKAVEMLESIKLFLDVPGCAFVLALDDEVVERGIVHRYRDYIFQGPGRSLDGKTLAQLPITGPEYLEKIINLPFRLPQPTEAEITAFLLSRYPALFESKSTEGSLEASAEAPKIVQRARGETREQGSSNLLNLFAKHIPPVPRKHIRAAELMLLMREIVTQRGCDGRIKDIPLAKLTLLQLFAPDVYRFGRRRHIGFLRDLQSWTQKPYWGRQGFKKAYRKDLGPLDDADQAPDEQQQIDIRTFDRQQAPLIEAFEAAAHSRSGFDPYRFISDQPLADEDLNNLRWYFSLVEEVAPEAPPITASAEAALGEIRGKATASVSPGVETATPSNVDEFLDLLFSTSPGSWQTAVQRPELKDRRLDESTFGKIIERLKQASFSKRLESTEWVALVLAVLSPSQAQRLVDIEKPDGFPDTSNAQDKPTTVRPWLKHVIEHRTLDVKQRAEAGRILSDIGDSRRGISIKKDANGAPLIARYRDRQATLPDIDWVKIPAGRFRVGAEVDDKEAFDQEKPAHDVSLPAFQISRYPVTNAQFRCFVEAGMYEDEAFWREKLPEAARRWLGGGAADEKLLASSSDENFREQYRKWLVDDTKRKRPRFWADRLWNLDNHPVVGVSWYEALAFCEWLSDLEGVQPMKLQGHCVRLPTEAEWEYAARGTNALKYAWGNEFDAKLGNTSDTRIGRTMTVGAFRHGQAFDLFDMTGNTWEWTLSRWGKSFDTPDFTYAQWKEQQVERNQLDPVEFRVIRGGSWNRASKDARCSYRGGFIPDLRNYDLGFRVVYSLANSES